METHLEFADGTKKCFDVQYYVDNTNECTIADEDDTDNKNLDRLVASHEMPEGMTKAELDAWTATITKEARSAAFADSSSPTSTFVHDFTAAAAPPRRGSAPTGMGAPPARGIDSYLASRMAVPQAARRGSANTPANLGARMMRLSQK